ncbi:hypothetical protein LOTGIDRAFT_239078 [Lottia gigantea]|uniref:Uncharacterized protein n=1 Tax=Lottia gigantea TaxID=225164 RepID=V4AX86_LOTGI|nr:hypothetical protein LOTGIDRAFT_239078 [Lottia gigantea]ESO98176.1 hypothetical protein LOTGIDRAFT_239078 [Lottia gigantea]
MIQEKLKVLVIFLRRKNYILSKHSSIDTQAELLNLKRPRKLYKDAVPTIYNRPVIMDQQPQPRKRRAHTESRLQSKHRKDEVDRILSESNLKDDLTESSQENESLPIGQGFTCEPAVQCDMSVQTDFIVFPQVFPPPSSITANASTETATIVEDTSTQCDDIFASTYGLSMEFHSYCSSQTNRVD